jgi:hypothetical protein
MMRPLPGAFDHGISAATLAAWAIGQRCGETNYWIGAHQRLNNRRASASIF